MSADPLLNIVQRLYGKAVGRKDGPPPFFRNAKNDIAAIQVLKIIREGTNGV